MLLYFFSFLLISFSYANPGPSKDVSVSNKTPLVLQWEVSHPRNTDQISLIFRQDTVELVTNISFSTEELPRLGSFSLSRNPYFKTLEKRIHQYYIRLKNTIPVSSLIKRRDSQAPIHPHAPVLHINDQKIDSKHTYFETLKDILFQEMKSKDWRCQECATYKLLDNKNTKTKNQKIIKKESPIKIQRIVKKNEKTTRKIFTAEELQCRIKGKNSWECLDSEFGIFVLKKTNNKKELNKQ